MPRTPLVALLVALLLAGGCPAYAPEDEAPRPDPDPDRRESPAMERITVDSNDTYLSQIRGMGGELRDFLEEVPAGPVDPETHTPVRSAEAYTVDGRPILWIPPSNDRVIVDESLASDLSVVDAARLHEDERAVVGTLREPLLEALSPREVAAFLVESAVVQTFWHIGSELELVDESREEDLHRIRFEGTHTYFTNEENVDPLDFTVELDVATGEAAVVGND